MRYSGQRITGIDEKGIKVWELFGPDMSDYLVWLDPNGEVAARNGGAHIVDWNKFSLYKKQENPFLG